MRWNRVVVLDFGSQYTHLIVRILRELNIPAVLLPPETPLKTLQEIGCSAIVLSGGPASVFEPGSPHPDPAIFSSGIPILGICYGMQLLGLHLGGKVTAGEVREYGKKEIKILKPVGIFSSFREGEVIPVWMSHGDEVKELPPSFCLLATTEDGKISAMGDPDRKIYGVQFHPEVAHTPRGKEIFQNFLLLSDIHSQEGFQEYAEEMIEKVREEVGDGEVLCALSGGVDSMVVAKLIASAIGERLHCIFVDTGLLRRGEVEEVKKNFSAYIPADLKIVRKEDLFLSALKGVVDPEEKRLVIREKFVEVFHQVREEFPRAEFLAQGTLYPDRIESGSVVGPSARIKSHHNVQIDHLLSMKLIEPLKDLFKDEVRKLGKALGLPDRILYRHPFPGPGLAVRIVGEVTKEKLSILRSADGIFLEELEKNDLYSKVWQAFAVLLPVRTVGVMGDQRSYEYVVALRAVVSRDGMTADFAEIPLPVLGEVARRIVNEVRGVNRVVYDLTSKPPATIEWE